MFMPTPGTIEKVLMDLKRANVSKNMVNNAKTFIFKPLFGALPKIGDWIQKYVQISPRVGTN